VVILCCGAAAYGQSRYDWDISAFGEITSWTSETGPIGRMISWDGAIHVPQSGADERNIGVSWQQERDIHSIEVVYSQIQNSRFEIRDFAEGTKVQYWFRTWPGEPPTGHTIEDRFDDPWQGKWLTAQTDASLDGNKVTYRFKPLTKEENSRADNLPEPADYRRSLKVRLLYDKEPPRVSSLKVSSPTEAKPVSVRIEFGCGGPAIGLEGRLEITNGWIEKVTPWGWDSRDEMKADRSWTMQAGEKPKGVVADLKAAKPRLPGSNDLTIVTVRLTDGAFSFLVDDLEKGPIYIPAYDVFITRADDPNRFAEAEARKGRTVREKIRNEPEQTYDRARKEIPPLDVMLREDGGRLYLPVAADASWQKFAVEWGGGFFMNRDRAKAKGKELHRCNWQGSELHWYIGTGAKPVYDRNDVTSQMSVLGDDLPVPIVRWNHDGLSFCEEAFATLLEGPLSPHDPLSEAILDDWEDNITLSSSLGQHIHGVVDDEYWFTRGGMVFQPNLQNPIQAYLLRNEVPAAIRSIYNAMTSCLYPDVSAFTEEYRRWRVGSGPMYKIPDGARFVNRVCDLLAMEVGDELWLAAGTPRRWLEPGRRIEVYGIETAFGKVAYTMRHGDASGTVEADITMPDWMRPKRVLLFVRSPFERPIKSVRIDGQDWRQWDNDREAVVLPARSGTLRVTISYD